MSIHKKANQQQQENPTIHTAYHHEKNIQINSNYRTTYVKICNNQKSLL